MRSAIRLDRFLFFPTNLIIQVMQRQLISILTIAGSDCSGGAGIQADIRAAALRGVFATTAVTAVTVQNSHGLTDMIVTKPSAVIGQMKAIFEDSPPMAIKIGMIGSLENGRAIATFLKEYCRDIAIVIDPVMKASAGGTLSADKDHIIGFYVNDLFPLATIVTPNLEEAECFGAYKGDEAAKATLLLKKFKCRGVVLKGGHSAGNLITDTLAEYAADDVIVMHSVTASRENCRNLHGTGCTFSSILAAELAKGSNISEAFRTASWTLKGIISDSSGYSLGNSGYGPLNLFNYRTSIS